VIGLRLDIALASLSTEQAVDLSRAALDSPVRTTAVMSDSDDHYEEQDQIDNPKHDARDRQAAVWCTIVRARKAHSPEDDPEGTENEVEQKDPD
jgi:hypothetical protein